MFDFSVYRCCWIFLFLYRYLRFFVNVFAFLVHRPITIPSEPTLTSRDVTVVIPTLGGNGIEDTIFSILATDPFEIILVTIDANAKKAQNMIKKMATSKVQVFSVAQPNKRRQMVRAIPHISTPVTVFADDDVTWPPRLLPWMLAPLESKAFGGVGTNQALRRNNEANFVERIWGFLGAVYLQRRNFDCAACNRIDGGLPCLSGRTVAYRTKILCDDAFIRGFTNEVWGWNRNYQLNADDDNFITRWLVSHGHKMAFQYHREAEVLTELETNSKFLKQCLRWSRSNWRSNITSMCVERFVWSQQPWSSYAVFMTTFTHWALLWDFCLWWFLPDGPFWFWTLLAVTVLSKTVKLSPLFLRDPLYAALAPVSVLFGYFHGAIKLYAALTLHVTAWGSREGADDNDAYRMIHIPPTEMRIAAGNNSAEVFTQ